MGGMSRMSDGIKFLIDEHNKSKMKIPTTTSSINIGSSSQSTNEETTTSNKRNTYNRNSKRGTRLVRSSNNG